MAREAVSDGGGAPKPETPEGARPVVASRRMVVSADGYASEAGLETLRAGGNAVDAAVATAFALAVVNPEAGNLGGSGYLVLRLPGGACAALDFRGTAPSASTRDMFLDGDGALTERSVIGHLSVCVPGSVRALWDAHVRFGRLPWARVVEPARSLARGFTVRPNFLRSFTPKVVEGLRRYPESARVFLPGPGATPPRVGDTFRQPELEATLGRIATRGSEGFYEGETARLIAAEMARGGGVLTEADLAAYRTVWREPLRFRYGGYEVVSMPPSSSGGVTLAESAHMLEGFALGALPWHGREHVHLMAEAWRRAYADRNHYLGDPAFVRVPDALLASPEYGRWRARDVSRERATPSGRVAPGVEAFLAGAATARPGEGPARAAPREGPSTTHLSVVDDEGGALSLTTTINTWYGSKVVAAGTGVLLNNDMDDFACKPGAPNYFGLVQWEANAIAPGKRPLSAMTPTLVLGPEGGLFMVLGTPGGATIITTTFQVLSNVIDHRMNVAEAVRARRVHHQHLPDRIEYERGGLSAEVAAELREMGHTLHEREVPAGDVQAILVRMDGTLEGASDPRRGGSAKGE